MTARSPLSEFPDRSDQHATHRLTLTKSANGECLLSHAIDRPTGKHSQLLLMPTITVRTAADVCDAVASIRSKYGRAI